MVYHVNNIENVRLNIWNCVQWRHLFVNFPAACGWQKKKSTKWAQWFPISSVFTLLHSAAFVFVYPTKTLSSFLPLNKKFLPKICNKSLLLWQFGLEYFGEFVLPLSRSFWLGAFRWWSVWFWLGLWVNDWLRFGRARSMLGAIFWLACEWIVELIIGLSRIGLIEAERFNVDVIFGVNAPQQWFCHLRLLDRDNNWK